jgi:diguanylate cyclase (GGDEF)-like protein/PAS domain S-box-containing protein
MPSPLGRISLLAKVVLTFGTLLLGMTALDLISLGRLVAVDSAIGDVRDNQMPSVSLLQQMAHMTSQVRLLEASLSLNGKPESRALDEAAMIAAIHAANDTFKAYDPLATRGEERRLADETWNRWQAYLALHEQFMSMTQRDAGAAVAAFYLGAMRAAFDRFQDMLQPLIRFNVNEARKGAEAGVAIARSATIWIFGVNTAMSVLCVGIGWWFIRRVSVPIARITAAMRRLSRREMDVAIPGRSRGDEIGAMADAIDVFKDEMLRSIRLTAERDAAREQELRHLRQFADATFEGIVMHRDGTIRHANTALCTLLGYADSEALRGRSVLELVAPNSIDAARDRIVRRAQEPGELEMLRTDGSILPVQVLSRAFGYNGEEVTLSAVRDLSERKQAEARIRQLAFHDALTGLPNRYLLNDRLTQALELSARTGSHVALLCLDLDRFKFVNDLLGHEAGDLLLVEVAARLTRTLRAMDTVARLGGDEFVIVQALAEQPQLSATLARRVIEAIAAPYEIKGHQVEIGVSIGVATYPEDGETAAALLKNGDTALYRAKNAGRGQFKFFEAAMDVQLSERRKLEQDLRQAFAQRAFTLNFQPLCDCASRELQGFEALLRWTHPTRGAVSPAEFIPIAEECGLIMPLGQWVLETACAEAASWSQPWSIAVNLSPMQFRDPDLPNVVAGILARVGLAPERLELEVTESVLISNPEEALSTLTQLKAQGIRISLDDFGTGYSSLSYLRRFPFDKLKIDKSFIHDCDTNPDASAIVAAIVTLGHCLHISVTAEGVETESQLDMLMGQHCHQVQGYFLGYPQPVQHLSQYMDGNPLWPDPARGAEAGALVTA